MMRGTYGDLKNVGGPKGGTITAAAFLKHFADGVPWVHLDIAGTAYDDGARVYNQGSGATGVGVRLLCRLLLDRYGGETARGRSRRAGDVPGADDPGTGPRGRSPCRCSRFRRRSSSRGCGSPSTSSSRATARCSGTSSTATV